LHLYVFLNDCILLSCDHVLVRLVGSIPQFNLASMTYNTSPLSSPETGLHKLFFVYVFLQLIV